MKVEVKSFGSYQGVEYNEIFITNSQGTQISFSDLGARINRWGIESSQGTYEQIILGHQNAEEIFTSKSYYGATIGRIAGRIELGKAEILGKEIQLDTNNGANHLHGGFDGFDLQKFDYVIHEAPESVTVEFDYLDLDGHNQYPGNLSLKVLFTYNEDNEWTLEYQATTDQPTLFNPTNHVYFNLNGDNSASVENHLLQVASQKYMPLKNDTIPLGTLEPVEGSVFDLRQPVLLSERLTASEPQFEYTKGYDHPWLIDKSLSIPHASITLPEKGRRIEMFTDEVAVVIYAHGYLTNIESIWHHSLEPFAGITLETQNLPNAINNPIYGDTILIPGSKFNSKTTYKLTI